MFLSCLFGVAGYIAKDCKAALDISKWIGLKTFTREQLLI